MNNNSKDSMQKDYSEYEKQRSDLEMPITSYEKYAYIAGWQDCYRRLTKNETSKGSAND